MNSVQAQWPSILHRAQAMKLPVEKPRAIVREYLQSMVITTIYREAEASKLLFTGGTALRLLRGLDRFSEDLYFDNIGISEQGMDALLDKVVKRIRYENIEVELVTTHKAEKNYFELRFPHLLAELKISTNPKEKLMIKIDYARVWQGQKPETKLFSQYGFLERVIVNPLAQALVEKLAAYVGRKQTQPRDIYDVVWLYTQGARWDGEFATLNQLGDVVQQALEKYQAEGVTASMRQRLLPFLFDQKQISRLDLFSDVLGALRETV
jgi:predicted nucleotidyltransferase component of viral defense system